MANVFTPLNQSPATPVQRWQANYQQRVARATDIRDERMLQRLHGFGRWSTVLVDLILLLIVEFMLSIVLLAAAVVMIGIHDRDFSRGLSASATANRMLQGAADWSLSPAGLALGAIVTQVGIVSVLYLRLVRPGLLSWKDLGLDALLHDKPMRAIGIGLCLGVAAYAVGLLVLTILQALHLNVTGQETTLKSVRHSSLVVFLPFALTAAVTAPLAEETFFRGYVLRALTTRYNVTIGLLWSSVAFGALHLLGGVTWEAVALIAVGAVLGIAYARTGNLLTNVTAHMFNNVVGLILLYNM